MIRRAGLLFSTLLLPLSLTWVLSGTALAQAGGLPLPPGHRYSVGLASTPSHAAIYVIDKSYGVQGYTPMTLKLPKGSYPLFIEAQGYKPATVTIDVTRSQAFAITLERAPQPAILDLRAGTDQSAVGADITVDGTAVGALPNQIEVGAGSHTVELQKAGFLPWRDSLKVGEGEVRTVVVSMTAEVKPGAILVTADVPGAVVFVDGKQRDATPALIGELPEGAHTVEVRPPATEAPGGARPWKQVVMVQAGAQTKVAARLLPEPEVPAAAPVPAATGSASLRVLSPVPDASVYVDGQPAGAVGQTVGDLAPGTHLVELRAQGYAPLRMEVPVADGELKVVRMEPRAVASPTMVAAGLRVISPLSDVEVFIDGADVGKAPVTREDLAPGRHFVVARASGHAEFKTQVELVAGQTREVAAELSPTGSLRVVSSPPGAAVFVDGTAVGTAPLTADSVSVGEHVVELRMPGHVDHRQSVVVAGGQQLVVQAELAPVLRGPTREERERAQREQSSWSAMTLDPGHFTVDLGSGYPYFLYARLTAGVFRYGRHLGMDLGVEARSYFYDTQVGVRPRLQVLHFDPFALAVDMAILGGGGPTDRNSFTFEFGPVATLKAGQYVHINFHPYLDVWSDRLCPSVGDIKQDDLRTGTGTPPGPGTGSLYKRERAACETYFGKDERTGAGAYLNGVDTHDATAKPFVGPDDPRGRFVGARFMLQLSVEVAVSAWLNVYALIEGAPGQKPRGAYSDQFNRVFPTNDLPIYGRAGVTGKF